MKNVIGFRDYYFVKKIIFCYFQSIGCQTANGHAFRKKSVNNEDLTRPIVCLKSTSISRDFIKNKHGDEIR